MLRELYIQSNIPIIVLAVSIICILVIGFLEVKKINNRIDHLNTEVDNLRSNKSSSPPILSVEEEKSSDEDKEEPIQEKKTIEKNVNKETFKNQKEVTDDKLMERSVELEHVPMMGGEEVIIGIGGPPGMPPGMFPFPGMGGILGGMVFEESVPPSGMEQESKNEIVELEEDDDSDNENEKKEMTIDIDEDDDDDEQSSDESERSSSESDSDSDNEDIEEVLSNKEKMATSDMSIKQLKEMCNNLDLSTSGNKSQLVKRINENINKV